MCDRNHPHSAVQLICTLRDESAGACRVETDLDALLVVVDLNSGQQAGACRVETDLDALLVVVDPNSLLAPQALVLMKPADRCNSNRILQ